ncbi:MAG: precorrin-8X methylmutase [Proteobacteria bacterium]|nr:precorrin-8X methylmutase [Pseudomonadota bacterium]
MNTYLKDPDAIYEQSFSSIEAEADLSLIPTAARPIAVRVIHACGMTEVARNLIFSPDFVSEAQTALARGCKIFVDAEMVRHGIMQRLLPDRERIICTLNDPAIKNLSRELVTTRSAAAVELWKPELAGSIVVIGNAPTALFHLLDMIDAGGPKPAAIVGFPVGFVGAAESKDLLITRARGIPFAALRGRQGGSAMAAAVINALLSGQE